MPDRFDGDWAVEVDDVATAAPEFHPFLESIEVGAYSHDEYNDGDAISDAAVFDKFEGRVFEDPAGEFREILEVAVLIGVEVGDEPRDQDAAEQGQEDTEDLCGGETAHGSKTEIEQDKCGKQGGNVGVQHGRKGAMVTVFDGHRVAFAVGQLFLSTFEDNYVGVHRHADGKDKTGDTGRGKGGVEGAQYADGKEQVEDECAIGDPAGGVIIH